MRVSFTLLVIAQTLVSVPLNSQPVIGCRKGGAMSSHRVQHTLALDWDMLHVGLAHVGLLLLHVIMLWVTDIFAAVQQ